MLPYRGCRSIRRVTWQEVSPNKRYLLTGGVALWDVFPYRRCRPIGCVLIQVSLYRTCPLTRGVPIQEVSLFSRCRQIDVPWMEVSPYEICFHTRSVAWQVPPTYGKCPVLKMSVFGVTIILTVLCLYFIYLTFFVADYPHDPYSDNNPYNSICSRGDLLIPSDRSPDGCYDTKVRLHERYTGKRLSK